MKIAVVEDNIDLLQEMVFMLQHHGHEARGATDGVVLERLMTEDAPDLVLLDVGLPGEDGFTIADRLRHRQPAPGVVMLTARAGLDDRVLGLQSGADHYLVKPVDRRELLAVLERVFTRVSAANTGMPPAAAAATTAATAAPGDGAARQPMWVLDGTQLRIASPLGGSAALTAGEHRVLLHLVQSLCRPVARSALLAQLGREDNDLARRSLEVKISRLRKKLRDINDGEAPLRAEWGEGYVFAERCRVV